jgi:Peptidase family M28
MREISIERLQNHIQALLGPHTRLVSSSPILRAEQRIHDALQDFGWPVERQSFSFENAVGALDYGNGEPVCYRKLEGVNIVATKPGKDSRNALVVLAHYDTRRDTPGADDNIASVAGLLELARILSSETFRQTIILAATDLEEILCFGAKALVSRLARDFTLRGVINFETMAFLEYQPHTQRPETSFGPLYRKQIHRMAAHQWAGDFTMIIYRGSSAKLASAFAAGLEQTSGPDTHVLFRDPGDLPVMGSLLKKTLPFVRNFSRSDHVPFWDAGIPAIQVTDTANFRNPNYHQPTDLPETLDYDRLAAIVGATSCALRIVSD